MKIHEYSDKIKLKSALDIATPIFVLEHNWNVDDEYEKVVVSKRSYIERVVIEAVKTNRLKGELIWSWDTGDHELDHIRTWLDMKEAFEYLFGILSSSGALNILDFLGAGGVSSQDAKVGKDTEDIDESITARVDLMSQSDLRKKVKELTNEKVKWDRSLEIACRIGLLFYEKGLTKPATEKDFSAEYHKWFEGVPKKTVSMIYKSLPNAYRNLGERPAEVVANGGTLDEEMVDTILEASVYAGFVTRKEGARDLADLKDRLEGDDVVVPSYDYMKRIAGTCKRVALKHR